MPRHSRPFHPAPALLAALLALATFGAILAGRASAQEIEGPPAAPSGPAPDAAAVDPAARGAAPAEPALVLRDEPLAPEVVLATTRDGDITMQHVFDYYGNYLFRANAVPVRPIARPDAVPYMPDAWLDRVARSLAIARAAEAAVEKIPDPEERASYEQAFGSWLLNYALPELRRRMVDDRLTTPTLEVRQKYYETRKPIFERPFRFHMRHLFLPTYEPYVVVEGDTLEAIAERVAGDPAAVAGIRANLDGRPLRWIPPEERQVRLFKALVPGEKLLVPMRPERVEAVRRAMEKILELHGQGRSLEELARKYSQAEIKGDEIGPLPSGVPGSNREMLPEIVEAARNMKPGDVSPILRTRHGFTIFEMTRREEAGALPFEEADSIILADFRKRQVERLERELVDMLFAQPELVIDHDAFARAPDLQETDPVLRVGDHAFLWKDVKSVWEKSIQKDASPEAIVAGLKTHSGIFNALGLVWCRNNEIFAEEGLELRYSTLRTGVMGARFIDRQLSEYERMSVTEEDARKRYEDRKDAEFSLPDQITFQIVEVMPGPEFDGAPPEAREAELARVTGVLRDRLAAVDSIPKFIAVARDLNLPSAPNHGGRQGTLSIPTLQAMGETGRRILELPEGKWTTEPFVEGGVARAVAVIDRLPRMYRPYPEVRNEIAGALRKKARDEAIPRVEAQWIAISGYQFVLGKETAAASGAAGVSPESTEPGGAP